MPFGIPELLLIFAAMILLFGGKKIPELAIVIGKAIKDFRKPLKGTGTEGNKEITGR
jgi:sec-independent protein translocase protein TatA